MRRGTIVPSFNDAKAFSPAVSYDCAYCGRSVASEKGWPGVWNRTSIWVLLCPLCGHPTYRNTGGVIPGDIPKAAPGGQLDHLPKAIDAAYGEARRCMSVGAYTGNVMVCRKLLM